MKNVLSCAATLICLVVSVAQTTHATVIGFTGDFAPSNWSTTLDGGDGYVNTSNAPTSIVIASADNQDIVERNTDFSIAMPFSGTVSFNWSYQTSDEGSSFDPFFVGIDGVFTMLTSDSDSTQLESGFYSGSILAGQILTLRANTPDSSFGRAETTVSNFQAVSEPTSAVPEPTSMAIFGLGALGMAYRQRRHRKA